MVLEDSRTSKKRCFFESPFFQNLPPLGVFQKPLVLEKFPQRE